jgi:hypothetical protein
MTKMRKIRNAVGSVLMACGSAALAVLDVILLVKWAKPSEGKSWPTDSKPSYDPHAEHMKQAQKVRQDEEDRRRRNEWEVRQFGHTKS